MATPRHLPLQSLASVMAAREAQSRSLLSQKFYRTREVALALDVNIQTVREWVHTGKISAVRTGRGRIRISEATLKSLQGVQP
jgi:excisionase family DNA binding protein